MKNAIFFDRDGTIIKTFVKKNKPIAIKTIKDLSLIKGVPFVLNKLKAKYKIFVITNQPDVARGNNKKKNVIEINKELMRTLPIEKVYTSYSSNNKNYNRKPNPGMIKKAKKQYNINLKKSYVVGDTEKDIIAGEKAGCKTILIKKKYNLNHYLGKSFYAKNLKDILKYIKF